VHIVEPGRKSTVEIMNIHRIRDMDNESPWKSTDRAGCMAESQGIHSVLL
jgi:hypothetical protein